MEYKKNQKYFKTANLLFLAGLPVVIAGLILAMLLPKGQMMIGVAIILAGIVFIIACLTSGMKDSDIDAAVATHMNTIEADAAQLFKFPRRYEVLRRGVILGSYDYTRITEGVPVKRGKDMKYRTEYYCGLVLNFTNDGLRILSKKFSVLKDEFDQENLHFTWEEIESAKLDEQIIEFTMVNGKTNKVPAGILKITLKSGQEFKYCVVNNSDVDDTIDIIYRQTIRVKKEELKNREQEKGY